MANATHIDLVQVRAQLRQPRAQLKGRVYLLYGFGGLFIMRRFGMGDLDIERHLHLDAGKR